MQDGDATWDPVTHSQEPGVREHCPLYPSSILISNLRGVCVCVWVWDSPRNEFRGIGDLTKTKTGQRPKCSQACPLQGFPRGSCKLFTLLLASELIRVKKGERQQEAGELLH